MGKYNSATINQYISSPSGRANAVNEYFNGLDGVTSELISTDDPFVYNNESFTGAKIKIDNSNIEIFFGFKTSDVKKTCIYIKNGEVTLYVDSYQYGGDVHNVVMQSYVEEGCIFLICDHLGINGFEILYVKTRDNKYLIGYNTSRFNTNTSPYMIDISSLRFEEVSDGVRSPLSYTNMFPFYAIDGELDFLNQAYFKNGNGLKMFETDILKECSTVNLLSTVSLPSPLNNYLALGAHCIVPLDDEEVSE